MLGVIVLLGAVAGFWFYTSTRAPKPPVDVAATPPDVPTAARCVPGQQTAGVPATAEQWAQGAQLFDGLGNFGRKVTTNSPDAQKYFDQGMRYLWAFNHDESSRSFAKAAQIDPACAMCWWGLALTVGPNYNVPVMAEPRAKVAFDAVARAQKSAEQAQPVEQALIAALGKRYPNAQPLDPSNEAPILTAYAQAMKEVAQKFPDDLDVQTLYAESMMNINAWKLWSLDGKPAPGTDEIVATLEKVLKQDAQHPGANHYYIHAMEASPHPDAAIASAERLRAMMPAAGHLVHMPAHILQRVGRYEDAAQANRNGVTADLAYFGKTRPLDYYAMYLAHNYQFLASSAAMEGRKAETVDAAKRQRATMPDEALIAMPGFDWVFGMQYAADVRFGLWDEMLAEPAPNPKLPGMTGAYLYGRAVALAAKGKVEEARDVVAKLDKLAADTPADYGAGFNSARDMFAIASLVAKARIEQAQGKGGDAIALLRDAVAREDASAYNEPADWFFPVRHILGARLLDAGKATDAEAVYRDDLQRHPANGWALFGLKQSLEAQHKSAEAAKVDAQFQQSWKQADVQLAASTL
jgi:tetratricopeptide (TPR) repeat protein